MKKFSKITNQKINEEPKQEVKKIDEADLVLFIERTSDISRGMLIELGYTLAKQKKTLLAIQKDIENSKCKNHIENVIEFDDLEDLKEKLSKI